MKKTIKKIFLVFPNNLFYFYPKEFEDSWFFLIEEDLFFKILPFHKHKLVFHRTSMKSYLSFLKTKGIKATYIDAISYFSDIYKLILNLSGSYLIEEIIAFDPVDDWLKKKIEKAAFFTKSRLTFINSPLFINKKDDLFDYFDKNKCYFQTEFYIRQRRKMSLLVDRLGLPVGGSWTYDKENRKRYPKNKKPPEIVFFPMDDFYKEAVEYVEKNFPKNVGEINKNFFLPKNHKEASLFFDNFLKERLFEFGPYQDAIVKDSLLINHSLLSPLLNAGIILPKEVIEKTINFYLEKKVPLSSVEGFLRQIVGWREFIRGVYEFKGVYQRTRNFFNFKKKMPKAFFEGKTGIELFDNTVKKIKKYGYCHHIERLMILGNFFLLCGIDPDEVYRFFMTYFIDAYDWVMVPNVYGMSQYADGGLMSTKPYFSSSGYLLKMSDYQRGDWVFVWDGLFWRFLLRHKNYLMKNPRVNFLVQSALKRKEKIMPLIEKAEIFLDKFF